MTDIAEFLDRHDLGKYLAAFVENEVDLAALTALSDDDLKSLGLPLGPRRKLQKALEQLESRAHEADTAPQEPMAERRHVTILFADLCRFSELSSELGAEDTHLLLNRYFETVDEIVESYGGTIDKHIGDCAMAVFGAPTAHTNDPERAIRAACDIHDAMRQIGEDFDRKLAAHIGIASGQVVASGTGSSRHSTYTITGESVNLASRLSDLAAESQTLVSDDVRNALTRFAEFSSHGDLSIKGFEKTVPVWEFAHLYTEPVETVPRKLVGRVSECSQFSALLGEVLRSGSGRTIIIRGEPGIGKTRLVEEFLAIGAAHEVTVCKTLVLDFGAGKGRDPVRTLTGNVLGLDPLSGKAERHQAMENALERGMVDTSQSVFLCDLLNLPLLGSDLSRYEAMDNATRNQGKQVTFNRLVQSHARQNPMLLLVEDVQWADRLTLQHLSSLAAALAEAPVLLILTSRLEGMVMDQDWLASLAPCPVTTMEVQRLRPSEAIELASEVSRHKAQVLEELVARAEGNPLFIEQLAQGGIEIAGDKLPDTLQGLVLARTDRLAQHDAMALKAASVIGSRFSIVLLRHLIDDQKYECEDLLNHRLVRRDGADYFFGHALIRDGVYASLLRADRQRLHAAAAEWFKASDPFLHAQHLQRADSPDAALAYRRAAEMFERQHQLERAREAARLGIEAADSNEDRQSLLQLLGRLLHDLGRLQEARDAYRSALDIAPDDPDRCRAMIGLAAVMRVTDQLDEAWQKLDHAEQIAVSHELDLERAEIHYMRGNLCFPLGKVEQCRKEHQLGLDFARKVGSVIAEAQSLGGLGDALYAAGMMSSANQVFFQCVEFAGRHGLDRVKNANQSSLASTRKYMLDIPTAIDECREAARVAQEIGAKRSLINSLHGEIELLIELQEIDAADKLIQQAKALIEELGAPRFMARALHYEGRLRLSRGERERACEIFGTALDISLETGSGYVGPTIASSLALSCDATDHRSRHLALGLKLLEKGAVAHNIAEYYRDAIEVALLEERWPDVPGLARKLRAFSSETLPWIEFWSAHGEALALCGAGDATADTRRKLQDLKTVAESARLKTALPALQRALDQSS